MAISLDSIPLSIRTPGQYIEIDNSMATGGLAAQQHRVLVIGQKLAGGAAAAGTPVRITSPGQALTAFGAGSMLARMFGAYKAVDTTIETWAFPLDENSEGVTATGKLAFSGPATAAGTLVLYIAGQRIQVAIASNDAATAIATKVNAAIGAVADLPVTSVVDESPNNSRVTLTSKWKGVSGNYIDLRANYYDGEALPAGVGVVVTAMSGGTGNPDVADVFSAIGDQQFQSFVLPYTDAANLTAIEGELEGRWGPLRQIEGMAYAAAVGSYATLATLGDARNSPFVSILGYDGSPMPPWEWAAAYAAQIARYGTEDPARPFQTLPLTGIMAPPVASRFTREERDLLLSDGISTFTMDPAGRVLIERAVTTYQEDSAGLPDVSYLDVNTPLTVAYLRFSLRARIAQKYPRHKLANDGTAYGPGQAIVTPSVIKAEILSLFKLWEAAGLVENIDQFKTDLMVERDADDRNRVNALIPPDIVNQFRVFAGSIQFRL